MGIITVSLLVGAAIGAIMGLGLAQLHDYYQVCQGRMEFREMLLRAVERNPERMTHETILVPDTPQPLPAMGPYVTQSERFYIWTGSPGDRANCYEIEAAGSATRLRRIENGRDLGWETYSNSELRELLRSRSLRSHILSQHPEGSRVA